MVTQVFEKEYHQKDYRPILLLPNLSKIIEKQTKTTGFSHISLPLENHYPINKDLMSIK